MVNYYNFTIDDFLLDFNVYETKYIVQIPSNEEAIHEFNSIRDVEKLIDRDIRQIMMIGNYEDINRITIVKAAKSNIKEFKKNEVFKPMFIMYRNLVKKKQFVNKYRNITEIQSMKLKKLMIEYGFVNRFDRDIFTLGFHKLCEIRRRLYLLDCIEEIFAIREVCNFKVNEEYREKLNKYIVDYLDGTISTHNYKDTDL